MNFVDPLGLWESGSYVGDVKLVFKGYGRAGMSLFRITTYTNLYRSARSLAQIAGACGFGTAAGVLGRSVAHQYTVWMHTSDPEEFGESFGTLLITAASAGGGAVRAGGARAMVRARAVRSVPTCFPAGTPIAVRDGERPIEQVRPGDEVLAPSGSTGATGPGSGAAGEPVLRRMRVIAREAAGGRVLLRLRDEQTGHITTVRGRAGRDRVRVPARADAPASWKPGDAAAAPLPRLEIEQVRPGDLVPARSERTGKTEYRKVVRTFRSVATELVQVDLADPGTGVVVESLRGTPEHPFFVAGRGMVPLGALGIGTSVVTRAGPALVVRAVRRERHPRGVAVYNFEVAEDHTYFVGRVGGGVWVHNSTCYPTVEQLQHAYSAATEPYKDGLSKAGRALTKHHSRPGSAFPMPKGNAQNKNEIAHHVVGTILGDPRSVYINRGPVFDIVAPNGTGLRFFSDGRFKGLLEP